MVFLFAEIFIVLLQLSQAAHLFLMRWFKNLCNVCRRLRSHINDVDGLFANDLPLLFDCLHELIWVRLWLGLFIARLDEQMFVHLWRVVLLHLVLEVVEEQHLWLVQPFNQLFYVF